MMGHWRRKYPAFRWRWSDPNFNPGLAFEVVVGFIAGLTLAMWLIALAAA